MFRRATALLVCPIRIGRRSVLVFLCLVLAAASVYVYRTHRQQRGVTSIRKLRGEVAYDYQLTGDVVYPQALSWVPDGLRQPIGDDFFHSVVFVRVTYRTERAPVAPFGPVDDTFLAELDRFPGLESLILSYGPQSEAGLRELSRLRHLKHLALTGPLGLSDESIVHVSALRCLESLSLQHTAITDDSLRMLGELPALENLDLRENRITDEGLAYAGQMQSLRELWLGCDSSNPAITDEGLLHLASLPRLQGLDLEGTAVTEQGLAKLSDLDLRWLRLQRTAVRDLAPVRKAFPRCEIEL